MSSPTAAPQDGRDVIAAFLPQSPFVVKLGIVAEVLEADGVRLRLPWDPTNTTLGDMVHSGAIREGIAESLNDCATMINWNDFRIGGPRRLAHRTQVRYRVRRLARRHTPNPVAHISPRHA
jgi:hypothetical protein